MRSSESLGNWGCASVGSKQRLFLWHNDAFFDLIGRWRCCWSNIRKISGIIAEDLSDSGPRRSFCGPDGAEISLSFKDTLFIIFFERLNDFYWKHKLWPRQAKTRKQLEKQLPVITSKYATRVVVCCENVIRRDSRSAASEKESLMMPRALRRLVHLMLFCPLSKGLQVGYGTAQCQSFCL